MLSYKRATGQTISKSYIDTHCKNIRWVSGLNDLVNINDAALNQIIHKDCALYKMIGHLKENLNHNYVFDTELVLQTALDYIKQCNDTCDYDKNLNVFNKSLDKYKSENFNKLSSTIPSPRIYNSNITEVITDVTNVLCNNQTDLIHKITHMSHNVDINKFLSNLCPSSI